MDKLNLLLQYFFSFAVIPPLWSTFPTKFQMMSTPAIILAIIGCYVVACKALRYARRDRMHKRFPYKTREDFSKMTGEDAWEIVRYCSSLEFPLIVTKSLEFALFKYVL